jgi:hypothetical protein
MVVDEMERGILSEGGMGSELELTKLLLRS